MVIKVLSADQEGGDSSVGRPTELYAQSWCLRYYLGSLFRPSLFPSEFVNIKHWNLYSKIMFVGYVTRVSSCIRLSVALGPRKSRSRRAWVVFSRYQTVFCRRRDTTSRATGLRSLRSFKTQHQQSSRRERSPMLIFCRG